jgi:hypothetical protein
MENNEKGLSEWMSVGKINGWISQDPLLIAWNCSIYLPFPQSHSLKLVLQLCSHQLNALFHRSYKPCMTITTFVSVNQNIWIWRGAAQMVRYAVFKYKVVQIWPGRFVCKQVTVCPGHIWTTLYIQSWLLLAQNGVIWETNL